MWPPAPALFRTESLGPINDSLDAAIWRAASEAALSAAQLRSRWRGGFDVAEFGGSGHGGGAAARAQRGYASEGLRELC
jgi:hypothetical protein